MSRQRRSMVALLAAGLRVLTPDGDLEALRMLTDRRDGAEGRQT